MVNLSKKKSLSLSKASRSKGFNLKKNSDINLEKNDEQGESSDFSWQIGLESESLLTEEDEIEREWNINITVGDNTLAVSNEKIRLGVDIAGVGFSTSNESGGTIGIGFGIVGIEYNMEGGGELDYFNGTYVIKVEKEGCTYVKDYYLRGVYTRTEIQLISNCDGRKPRDEWDIGPELPPDELTEDERKGNIPPGRFPEPPDVDDSCLVWAMVSYTFYRIPISPGDDEIGDVVKSTVILTEMTPLEEIEYPKYYDVGYQNITSRSDFGQKTLTNRWSVGGHHRQEFGRGSYLEGIPIPGNGATILYGTLEFVRGYIQDENYYNFNSSTGDMRHVGRIHRIQWHTNCALRLPSPYWPLSNYRKKMREECCFTEDDRTRLILTTMASGADDQGFPVFTPKTLQGFNQETIEIRNIPQYLMYLHRYLDEILGQFPVTIQIPDIDPATPGNQKSTPKDIPNISELLGEILGLSLQEAVNRSDKRSEFGMISEMELLKLSIFRLTYLVQAIADYLDFDDETETKEVKLAFNPADGDNFLERSKRNVEVVVFNEDARKNPSLNTVLNKLLLSAQSTQQAFKIPIDPGNITGSLIEFFKGVTGESEKDKLKRIEDLLESGRLSNDSIGIQDNPKLRKPNIEESNQS